MGVSCGMDGLDLLVRVQVVQPAGVPGDADKPTVFATGTTGQARLAAPSAIARRNCLTTNRRSEHSGPSSSGRDTASQPLINLTAILP